MGLLFNKDFLFVHVPKSAGTFMIKNIKRNLPRKNKPLFEGQHRPMWMLEDLCKNNNMDISRKCCFSTVRNPWSRMVSSWKYAVQMKNIFPELVSDVWKENEDFNKWVKWVYSSRFDRSATIGDTSTNLYTYWFNNQTNYFKTKDLKHNYRMDKILRVEDFKTEIVPFFRDVLKVTAHVPDPELRINETEQRGHYSTFYNKESIDLVGEHFEEDIEMFDYKFEE